MSDDERGLQKRVLITKRAVLAIGALLALLLWLSYVVFSTKPFQDCVGEREKSYKAAQEAKENLREPSLPLIVKVRNDTVCAGHVLYQYRDGVTALATVFIALFTLTLWWSTAKLSNEAKVARTIANKSADAARRAADAAVDSSRPVLLPRVVYSQELILPKSTAPFRYRPEIQFVFENYGKSVAVVTRVTSELLVFENEPPEFRDFIEPRITRNRVVIPGEYKIDPAYPLDALSTFKARLANFITDPAEIEALAASKAPFKRFYLVGIVEYEDLFGFEYEGGFCLNVFSGNKQGPRGGKAFNYYEYRKKTEPS